ncbi:MAG: ATP-binding protein [Actinomycetota bacterium]|nr:ATP-binding protein [Actinomycetota bacterium]
MTVNGPQGTVRDHGDGYPDTLLRDGPQPFLSGERSRGQEPGHGLTIAAAHAAALGAKLSLANARGGGACAILTLPADPSARRKL